MDADELTCIEDALLAAIAEAKAVVKVRGVGPQFREIVRHAPEMYDIRVIQFLSWPRPSFVREAA